MRGPAGPTAVSTDAGNLAKLGAESLLFVPSTVPLSLTVQPPSGAATLSLNKAAGGVVDAIRSSTNGVQRWEMDLGDNGAESGSSAGSGRPGYSRRRMGDVVGRCVACEYDDLL